MCVCVSTYANKVSRVRAELETSELATILLFKRERATTTLPSSCLQEK